MSSNPDDFGSPIAGSRWFNGEPAIERVQVDTFVERWRCPLDGCGGEMHPNGFVWSTNPPGIHHTCDACGFTAVPRAGARFPRTITVPRTPRP